MSDRLARRVPQADSLGVCTRDFGTQPTVLGISPFSCWTLPGPSGGSKAMTPIFKGVAAAALLFACFHVPSAFVPQYLLRTVRAPRLSAMGHGDSEDFGDIERGDAMDDNELDGGSGSRMPPRSVLSRPWDVEVDLYGDRHNITVQPGDSILEAAEMAGMNLSYECRRGTCTSCAAKVRDGSSGFFETRADRALEDGAPEGFILTCSTYPTGPGVKLELSANADMWAAYCKRLDDVNIRDLLRQASAGIMRKYRMEHPEEFRREMERQFDNPEKA